MALLRKLRNLKSEINTGFGTNASSTGGRFINKDGQPNVIKRGVGILDRYSWYHTLLGMKQRRFGLLLLCIFIGINLVFAGVYYLIGIDHLKGVNAGSSWKNFSEVFFFSAQTFTTVGYGRISPDSFAANAVSTFEAFVGLLSFALATGLFYGRFSRPQAFVKFSHNALIAPFRNGTAFMFRLAPYKNNSLALSWTIVHPIDDKSPFYGLSNKDIQDTDMEIMIFLKAFDQVFSNNVITRTSYVSSEIVYGAKFRMMYHPNEDKSKTILSVDKLNEFDRVDLPETETLTAG
jgi:inward rectifier potassium channel